MIVGAYLRDKSPNAPTCYPHSRFTLHLARRQCTIVLLTSRYGRNPVQALSCIDLDNRFALAEHTMVIEDSRPDYHCVKLSATGHASSIERASLEVLVNRSSLVALTSCNTTLGAEVVLHSVPSICNFRNLLRKSNNMKIGALDDKIECIR